MRLHRPVPIGRLARALGAAAIACTLAGGTAPASPGPVAGQPAATAGAAPGAASVAAVKLTVIATGLSGPLDAASPDDGTHRLFIVEKRGTVRIIQDGRLLAKPFLSLAKSVSGGSEQGLLGLAFHPSFQTNLRLYVDYTDLGGNTVVREYRASTADPNAVQAGSGRTVLQIRQPFANHNGGGLAFGPDGYLYIGMGDGGSAGDPGNRAQRIDTLLGKLLRIDVDGTSASRRYRIPPTNPLVGRPGLDEIWQLGLRNPWRFSFDPATGALWIGDVGQNRYEEVDRAVRTSSGAGRGVNWGWRTLEGSHCYSPSWGCRTSGRRPPLLEYSHDANGRCAVTGGYVYRGSAIPSLRGWYVFGDYCSGEVFAGASAAGTGATPVTLLGPGSGRLISSFGQDWAGELYVVTLGGTLYRIDPA